MHGLPALSRIRPKLTAPPLALLAFALLIALSILIAGSSNSVQAAYPGAQDGQIAFQSNRDRTGNGQIFVMGPAGQNPTNISNTDSDDYGDPSFSADGQKLVFSGDPDSGSDELYVSNADGDNRVRLTKSEKDENEPVFSPDGSQIAFTSFVNGSYPEIHLINSDGSNEHRLTVGPPDAADSTPSWSPDGSKIAFARTTNETNIYVVNVDGTNSTQLTPGDGKNDLDPDFSPDGSQIAFASDRDGQNELYLMNADGANQRRLTYNQQEDQSPAWSPGGSMIAFERRPNERNSQSYTLGNGEIMVIDATGQNLRSLTKEPDDGGKPSWQPLAPGADTTPPAFTGAPIQVPPLLVITRRATPPRAVITKRRKSGGAIRYRLSKSASAKLAIERLSKGVKRKRKGRTRCVTTKRRVAKRKRCTKIKLAGWLVRTSGSGAKRVSFTGRIGRKALKPGLYRVRAGAVDANANTARHKNSRTFKIVRR